MLTQKLVLSYSTKLILQVIQMATGLIVARLVGPTVIGTLAYGLAFVTMFSFITDLGTGSAHIKLVSSGNFRQDICIGTFTRIKLFLTILFILAVCGAYLYTKFISESGFESITHEYVILIYLAISIINQISSIATITWAANTEQAKQDIPDFLKTFIYQILRLVLAIIGYKAVALALGNLFAVIIVLPLYIYFARDIIIGKFDKELLKSYIKISIPVVFIGICQVLIFSTDKVYLKSQTNTTELGYYSAAFTLGTFIKTLEASVGLLLFPYFSKHLANNDYEKVRSILVKYERFTLAFLLPGIFLCSVFSDLIIRITFGSQFLQTIPIFSIIIISYSISLINLPYGNILFGMGFFKQAAIVWGLALISFFAFALFIVSPDFLNLKGEGMAIVLLLTNTFIASMTIFLVKTKTSVNIKVLPGYKILLFTVIYFVIIEILMQYFNASGYLLKIIQLFSVYIIFYIAAFSTGILKKSDYFMIKGLMNINKLKSYINNEIRNR
ncbi:MAG: oligosaccharide flippase family protein [Bacteroidales bacterium]|nr:oligosaccharide flippase family protein [Bacteroidales bacterium]